MNEQAIGESGSENNSIQIGMRVYDPDCKVSGTRWNGEPLSTGMGPGVVVARFLGDFFLVKHNSYCTPVMYSSDLKRYDRLGKTGVKRILLGDEVAVMESATVQEEDKDLPIDDSFSEGLFG